MTTGGTGGTDVFDVRKVRRLVELMNDHDLAEIDLRQGDLRIRLRRGQEQVFVAGGSAVAPPVPLAAQPPAAPATGTAAPADSPESDTGIYVTSPMVGTFYTASSPDAAPYVKVGDQVGPESVVCIIEAMKVFNEIPAGCSGKIVSLLVENGDAIEFGQKLYRLE